MFPDKSSASEDEAAPDGEAAPEGASPASDDAPISEPGSSEEQPSQGGASPNEGADGGEPAEKTAKEEPLISVKAVASAGEEDDEESVAPAVSEKKVTPTATIMKAPKKGKAATNKTKIAKGNQDAPAVVKTKAPVIVAEAPPPPVPAVPLTPISPRNP